MAENETRMYVSLLMFSMEVNLSPFHEGYTVLVKSLLILSVTIMLHEMIAIMYIS